MYQEEIKIPKDRVAVLIGKDGKLKREIEKLTNIHIHIDSNDSLITLKSEDSVSLFDAKPIIRAIARGFNPKIAELLIDQDYALEVIDLKDFAGDSKKKMIRLKSRCIGTGGKARESIEQLTNTHISVYGKTVSIIGKIENVYLAKAAVESLLGGSPHGKVYRRVQERKNKSSDK